MPPLHSGCKDWILCPRGYSGYWHGSQQITHPSMVMCVYWYWHYLMQNIVTMTASVSSPDWPIVCLLIILVAGGSWHRDNGAVCVTAWHGVMLIVGTLSTVDTQTADSVTLHTPAQINHLGQGGVTTTNTQLSSCHPHVNNNCLIPRSDTETGDPASGPGAWRQQCDAMECKFYHQYLESRTQLVHTHCCHAVSKNCTENNFILVIFRRFHSAQ